MSFLGRSRPRDRKSERSLSEEERTSGRRAQYDANDPKQPMVTSKRRSAKSWEPDARFRKVEERLRRSGRETIAEHRKTTKGFCLGRLVLNNVPMLGKLAVFDAHDIDGDP